MYRILLCVVLALSTLAPCHAADVLVNGGFDPGLTSWTRDFGSCFSDNCGRTEWRLICARESSAISQQVAVQRGQYNLSLSAYYMLPFAKRAMTLTKSYISFAILADGNEVACGTFTASGNPIDHEWTPWTLAGVNWSGSVRGSVGVRIEMQNLVATTPRGDEGYTVCADDVKLNANMVPEPNGIAALISAFGLMGASLGRKRSLLKKAA